MDAANAGKRGPRFCVNRLASDGICKPFRFRYVGSNRRTSSYQHGDLPDRLTSIHRGEADNATAFSSRRAFDRCRRKNALPQMLRGLTF